MPILLNADHYRTMVISYLEENTGKNGEIGRLAVTFPPASDSGGRFRGEESTVVSPELHRMGGADRCAAQRGGAAAPAARLMVGCSSKSDLIAARLRLPLLWDTTIAGKMFRTPDSGLQGLKPI